VPLLIPARASAPLLEPAVAALSPEIPVVTLAATIDELAGVNGQHDRELLNVLEGVAAGLEKLTPDNRRVFVAHVEAMQARAAADPLVSADYRQFLADFPTSFGLVENMN
jgi:hypothetical protein